MKTLKEYIALESLVIENEHGDIITEGFWKKLGSMFGYTTKKVSDTMSNWGDNMKRGFTTGQYIAAKSKDKDVKKAAKEQGEAAEKGSKELLSKVKLEVTRLMKKIDKIEEPDHCLSQLQQLSALSEQEKDDEGKELAKKFKEIVDKKWPDGGKEYKKIEDKIEKAGVDEGPKEEKSSKEANSDQKEEIKQDTIEVIKDNNDLLSPLAKEADIDGKTLLNFVTTQLSSLGSKATKNASNKEKAKQELGDDVILGTSIMICGALITKDEAKLKIICDHIQTSAESLLKKLNKHKSKS